MAFSIPNPSHVVDMTGTANGVPTFKGMDIHEAVRKRVLDAVAALLINNPDIVNEVVDGRMLVHTAAAAGDGAIMKMVLDKGGKINEKGSQGETPFLLAASSGSTTILGPLLDEGADPLAVDNLGHGIAHYAIQSPESFHFLHQRLGFAIPDDLLHYCCEGTFYLGALYCIEQLSMDVNKGNPSAIEIAARQRMTTDNKKLINSLLDNGAVTNTVTRQSLFWEHSNISVLKAGSPLTTLFAFLGPNVMLFTAAEYFPKIGGIMCIVNLVCVVLITKASISRRKPDPALAGWYFGGLVFGSFVLYTKILQHLEVLAWYHWLWYAATAGMTICYTKAFLSDPGEVIPTALGRQKFYSHAIDMKTGVIDKKKYFPRQNIKKPLRSKYCSTTNKLVHRFDHYCVWTCNAIGGGNIVPFYTFALFQLLSQILVATFTFQYFRQQYDELPSVTANPVMVCLYCDFFFSSKNATATFFLIAYNTAVLFFISAVVSQQTFYISRNVTSNDVWFPERYSWTFKIGTRVHTLFDEGVLRNFKNFFMGKGLTDPPNELPVMNEYLTWKISRFTAWNERRRQRINKFTGNRGLDPTIQVDDAGLLIPGGLVRTITLLPWAQRRDMAEKQANLIQSGVLKKDGLSLAQFIESEINPNSENKPLAVPPSPPQVATAPTAVRTTSPSGAVLRSASTHVRQDDS
eukprot:TRINITY_DN20844_c0_g2_i1.p1 TRINITY_DN20844_c0_g2~~TRINITY_DN20844_c0_g2_i1.p1  ORF type:complete len:688 (+),score=85.45 TRINITY_DN20844_c0_g2_i1:1488-3551(+)